MRSHLQAWNDFERIQRGRSAASVATYRRQVEGFLDWLRREGRPTVPEEVTSADVEDYLKALFYGSSNSNATRAGKLSAIRSYFIYLVYSGVILVDPTARIPSPKFQPRMPRKFSTEQLRKLFASMDRGTPRGIRDRALLMTIYGAGLRKAEVSGLDFCDIADTGRHIRLRVRGKGGKERTLTLRRKPAAALRAWLTQRAGIQGSDNAVFVALRGVITRLGTRSITTVLKKYAKLAGIPSVEAFVHKLRATWATDLYDAGHEVIEICKLAGWSDINTAQRYIAISERVLRRAAIPDRRWNEIDGGDGGGDEVR
jgi:site-specific recombinase XerD